MQTKTYYRQVIVLHVDPVGLFVESPCGRTADLQTSVRSRRLSPRRRRGREHTYRLGLRLVKST
jgi:hypothetical protein